MRFGGLTPAGSGLGLVSERNADTVARRFAQAFSCVSSTPLRGAGRTGGQQDQRRVVIAHANRYRQRDRTGHRQVFETSERQHRDRQIHPRSGIVRVADDRGHLQGADHARCFIGRRGGVHRQPGRTTQPRGRESGQKALVVAHADQHPRSRADTRRGEPGVQAGCRRRELAEAPHRIVLDEEKAVPQVFGGPPGQQGRQGAAADSGPQLADVGSDGLARHAKSSGL